MKKRVLLYIDIKLLQRVRDKIAPMGGKISPLVNKLLEQFINK